MARVTITPEDLDECLPQTQCGLCGYGGCMPYAEAICYEQAPIHLCPPGGVKTLSALANLLDKDPTSHLQELKPYDQPKLPIIREEDCIGCTKCIQVCPVDAILGSSKRMHTVIANECTGCELCVEACPVDCIDLILIENTQHSFNAPERKQQARMRFNQRNKRLIEEQKESKTKRLKSSLKEKQKYIEAALARVNNKKNSGHK